MLSEHESTTITGMADNKTVSDPGEVTAITEQPDSETASGSSGELFAFQLRLQPTEPGQISANAGSHVQAAFLDLVRQIDPALSDELHTPNRRRPYTLGMVQGFHHLAEEQFQTALNRGERLPVRPEQIYWLRVTTLDATIFRAFIRSVLLKAHRLSMRIDQTSFAVTRLVTDAESRQPSWIGSSSFRKLLSRHDILRSYDFQFATPTVFSTGSRSWGKYLHLFPEPALLFGSLATQWEHFAPEACRLATSQLTPPQISAWCADAVVVSQYRLSTSSLHGKKFGQVGFQGQITCEVKGDRRAPEARWLTPLARFALYSGIGYKTTMGMGQARLLSLTQGRQMPEERQA